MKIQFSLSNGNFDISFSKTKKIATKKLADNLLFVWENKQNFINDIRINRYLKHLKDSVRKNMVTVTTQGFGTCSAFYYISQPVLLNVLNNELKQKEYLIRQVDSTDKDRYQTSIDYLKDDINYFSKDEFNGKYFSLNGQHRMKSIIADLSGDLKKVKTDVDYAPLCIEGQDVKFDSLHDLYTKLCSAENKLRFPQVSTLSCEQGKDVFERYLKDCDIELIEIIHSDSFDDISNYIWYSNSSTSWSLFEHAFKQTKNPFTTFVRNKISSNKTDEPSPIERLIYEESGIDFSDKKKKAKFKKSDGGFEYLLCLLYDTAYSETSIGLLEKFAFRESKDMLNTLLNRDYVTSQSLLEQFYTDLIAVTKVFKKLNSQPLSSEAKELLKKPSSFINSLFLIRYLNKIYRYTKSSDSKYKIKIPIDKYEEAVKGYIVVASIFNNPMHPINTYFWETPEGIDMLDSIGQKPNEWFTSVNGIKNDSYRNRFEDFLKACKNRKRDKSDQSVAFSKHIGDSFAFGWNTDHSCVVNILNEHLAKAFHKKMINFETKPFIFDGLEWEDTTELTKFKYLMPEVSNEDEYLESLFAASDRGHKKSKSKGGANSAENLELEDISLNRKSKNVV